MMRINKWPKKKLLYIVTQAEWGGAQRYIFDLATNLRDEFDITVAVGMIENGCDELIQRFPPKADPPMAEKDLKISAKGGYTYGVKRLALKHLIREINPLQDILAIFEIRKLYKTIKPDIIHLNSSKAGVLGSVARLFNKLTMKQLNNRTMTVYTAHGWAYLEPLPFYKRWLYLWMEQIAAKLRDATIVLSEKEKDIALKRKTAKKGSVFIIPHGIDLSSMQFLSKDEAIKSFPPEADPPWAGNALNNEMTIGTIANLYKTKGLEYLIESIKILNIQYSILNTQTIIIGEGPERMNLESKIKNYGLSGQIHLVGSLDNAYQYLKALDIFVLPSVKEGFPYTLLEAMAAGLPIVATKVGAIPEIIEDQKTGLLVEPANPNALAEAIASLILNPQLAQSAGIAALESVKKFQLQKTMRETREIYLRGLSPHA